MREIGDTEAVLLGNGPIMEIKYDDYRHLKQERKLQLLNAPMTLQDDEEDATKQFPRWKYGLYEAVYMMTTFPEITRYLLWPILR